MIPTTFIYKLINLLLKISFKDILFAVFCRPVKLDTISCFVRNEERIIDRWVSYLFSFGIMYVIRNF